MKPKPFIPSWLDDAGLSAAEMRVFIHLLRSADNATGIAWPSYRRMTEITGLSKSTVRRCIESLEDPHKLIAMMGKPFAGSCRYKVLPIVPPEGQKEPSNSSTTGTFEESPIVPPEADNSSTRGTPIVPPEGQEGNPKKVLQGRQSNTATKTELPLSIPFNSEAFTQAWRDWQQHRREKKKPITPTSALSQFKAFIEWGEKRSIAAIEHSIRNGWTGVFEPSGQSQKPQTTVDFGGTNYKNEEAV